ncbi:MAG: PEP-CTERM sorting domain-containing protein [Burkholderiales bacterium]|nr:PEP-CTERM sorting domain-containing protein [Burkholderiales bacterium]
MVPRLASRFLFCGAVAVSGLLGAVAAAQAAPVRVVFTPPFGEPFPDLEWSGSAIISDGSCTATGSVSNFVAPCAGEFTFTSAKLKLSSIANPGISETLALTGSTVIGVQRSGLTPAEFQGTSATPFNPVQSSIGSAAFGSSQAYFSLVLVGGTDVQLYWFKDNPGTFYSNPTTYLACGKPGINPVGDNLCGQSTNTAVATFAPVPEPASYAMLAAGLGVVAWFARRRRSGEAR